MEPTSLKLRRSGWIKVTDRLPDTEGDYLVVRDNDCGRHVDILPYHGGEWTIDDYGSDLAVYDITHWMEIPAPPKDE